MHATEERRSIRRCTTCGVGVGWMEPERPGSIFYRFILNRATTSKIGARPGVKGYECNVCRSQGRPVCD